MHIHVAEGLDDVAAGARLEHLAADDWLLVHCVHLDRPLPGTIAHNPRSNMNNAVGYARPARWENPVVLGTDGIGADMLEEARLAYVRLREDDLTASPGHRVAVARGRLRLLPRGARRPGDVELRPRRQPWHVAFTPGMRALDVTLDTGEEVLRDGLPTRVDLDEVRAKAAEQAQRLFAQL